MGEKEIEIGDTIERSLFLGESKESLILTMVEKKEHDGYVVIAMISEDRS